MNLPHTDLRALQRTSTGAEAQPMPAAMALALRASFGSVDAWAHDFLSQARALPGGSGWLLLVWRPRDGVLVNRAAAAIDDSGTDETALLALGVGREGDLAMDGVSTSASGSADARLARLAWPAVHQRYQQAVEHSSQGLGLGTEQAAGRRLIDVRRAEVMAHSDGLIDGAHWRDPALVARWADGLRGTGPVLVYCVHGHEVSRAAAMRLRAAGVDAHFLIGGIEGWRAEGRGIVPAQNG